MAKTKVEHISIGSSDIAPILCISPFGDPWKVFASKKGLIEIVQTEQMFWGTMLEPVIATVFADRMGLPVEWNSRRERIYHPDRPWQHATLDGFIKTDPCQVLEIKTAGLEHSREWGRLENDEGVPDYYVAQVEWQLSTTGMETAWVAALIGGQDFRIYKIQHDPVLEEILLTEAEIFWREHLMTDVPPPIGASSQAAEYLRKRYPREKEQLRQATPEEISLVEEYRVLRRVRKAAEAVENRLKDQIGDAEGLSWPNGKMTWKRSKDTRGVNWEELARSQLVGYTKEEQDGMINAFTSILREGSRRIYFRDDRDKEEEAA